ncbi:MAG: GAF domain-containing protein, partial [Dehalococcoidia bacterium]
MTATEADLAAEVERLRAALADAERARDEAHEREAATAAVLRAISTSPTDPRRALDLITTSAAHLIGAEVVNICRLVGDRLVGVTENYRSGEQSTGEFWQIPIDRNTMTGRAVVDGRAVSVDDLAAMHDEFPSSQIATLFGHHSAVAVPLRHEGRGTGAITATRNEVRPFT